ncbi:MAG: ATP-dependent Clp protease ATP-binding subunit ClpX [Clostridia bacterium]|nr:ATP-dependent Clp protease ATP-binding subunit ClpX [Clostridia bacterium]
MSTKKSNNELKINLLTPKEIKHYLDEHVIGQDEAKKVLSVAIYNHYKRLLHNSQIERGGINIEKSNILLPGPTGSGKTFLVKTIANLINVPCYIQDCTKITESGFVGSDIEECLVGLLRACDYDSARAEVGIVVLDEIDKTASKGVGANITRDPSGEGVQQGLLKMVEGDLVGVPPQGGRKHPEQPLIYVNTKNILFIAAGAFVGIEDIIKKRIGTNQIGFQSQAKEKTLDENTLNYITTDDIREFGMIPEFVGRFPIITHTNKLSEDDLVHILTEPKNALVKQYTTLISYDNTNLVFSEDALKEIAKIAINLGTGARGLRNVIETVMTDIMFDAPDNLKKSKPVKVTITDEYVREHTRTKYKIAS